MENIFKPINLTEDMDIYQWTNKNERERITIYHRHTSYCNTVKFEYEEFKLKDEYKGDWVPMETEQNESVKHSCKYAHWQPITSQLELTLDIVEFAEKILKEWENKQCQR